MMLFTYICFASNVAFYEELGDHGCREGWACCLIGIVHGGGKPRPTAERGLQAFKPWSPFFVADKKRVVGMKWVPFPHGEANDPARLLGLFLAYPNVSGLRPT